MMVLSFVGVYLASALSTCKKPSSSDKSIASLLMIEVIDLLGKACGSHARKGFDVVNQMRLVSEVKSRCHIGQPGKASGFDEVDRCIKALHPKIRLRGQSYRLSEAPFKLAFREMERVEQVFDTQRTNVHIDQTEAFLHKQISRFRLLEQSQQEGGEKRHLFLPAAGFHQLTCQIERPILLWTYPPGSK